MNPWRRNRPRLTRVLTCPSSQPLAHRLLRAVSVTWYEVPSAGCNNALCCATEEICPMGTRVLRTTPQSFRSSATDRRVVSHSVPVLTSRWRWAQIEVLAIVTISRMFVDMALLAYQFLSPADESVVFQPGRRLLFPFLPPFLSSTTGGEAQRHAFRSRASS